MSVKEDLAILFSSKELPIEEFKKLSAFANLEQKPDIVEKLKEYHLPEITRLICASVKLREFIWAEPYSTFSQYCLYPEKIDAVDELLNHTKLEEFEKEFLIMKYEPVIRQFEQFFKEENNRLVILKSKKTEISKTIKKLVNSEINEEVELEKNIRDNECKDSYLENEKKLEEIDHKIFECERFDKVFKKHQNRIQFYLEQCSEEQENKDREAAYKSINDVQLTREEFFIREFIHSGELTAKMQAQLEEDSFRSRLLLCLEKASYIDIAFPILIKLYEESAIDLETGEFRYFILQHKKNLKEYLKAEYEVSPECLNNIEKGLLFEIAIQMEIEELGGAFSEVWNLFVNENSWLWLKDRLDLLTSGESERHFYKFAVDLRGKAAQVFVQVLYDKNVVLSPMDVLSKLLSSEGMYSKDVVLYALRLQEQSLKRTQRKINALDRKINSQEQELFSSIYNPMEQLEELASNLRCTEGSIECNLVAGQLMNMIELLRDGLSSMGVETIVDSDEWKRQMDITYDAEKHRFTILMENIPEMVKPRTMGFLYRDDDGNEQFYPAKVYTEIRKAQPKNLEKSAIKRKKQFTTQKNNKSKSKHNKKKSQKR